MIPQYNHDFVTSFTLWLDNRIQNVGQAYVNVGTPLYPQTDPSTAGYKWASPYQSWVFDSCVSGATIPSGVYTSSGQFLTRASGIVIDYVHGRVISPYNWGAQLSGNYARKEINVYFATEEQTNFWLEHIFNEDPNIRYANTGGIASRFAAPCVIWTNARTENLPWGLGGSKDAKATIRAFAVTDSNYLQEGLNSLLADSVNKYIPMATYADAPIGTSGDLKGGFYNYCTGVYDRYGCGQGSYVEKVVSYKMNEMANRNTNYNLSIMEFDLSKIRLTV